MTATPTIGGAKSVISWPRIVVVLKFFFLIAAVAHAQDNSVDSVPEPLQNAQVVERLEEKIRRLESDVRRLKSENREIERTQRKLLRDSGGVVVFLFGVFCALWAQNTGRNAWLWFFMGVFFNIITVLVLLSKNADDRRIAKR